MPTRFLILALVALLISGNDCKADVNSDMQGCESALAQRNANAAIAFCRSALESGQLTGPNLASAHANFGTALNMKGDRKGAISEYSEAIRLNPNDAAALYLRGSAHHLDLEFGEAVRDLDRAIELKPDDAAFHIMRGLAYFGLGNFYRAEVDFSAAIKIQPNDAGTYYRRANAQFQQGYVDLAIQDLDRALELNPDLADAYVARGLIYLDQGQRENALHEFDRAIEHNRDSANGYLHRGKILLDLGDFQRAVHDFEKSIALDPENTEPLIGYGSALFFLGHYADAVTVLERVPHDNKYGALYLALAREHIGQDGLTPLSAQSEKLVLTPWPGPVVQYFIGLVTEEYVRQRARRSSAVATKALSCQAEFFIAQLRYALDSPDVAKPYLLKAADACSDNSKFYPAVQLQLDRM